MPRQFRMTMRRMKQSYCLLQTRSAKERKARKKIKEHQLERAARKKEKAARQQDQKIQKGSKESQKKEGEDDDYEALAAWRAEFEEQGGLAESLREALRNFGPEINLPEEVTAFLAEVQKEQAPKEVAYIGIEGSLAKSYQDLSMNLKEGEWIEHFFEANGNQGGAIKKDVSTLSKRK